MRILARFVIFIRSVARDAPGEVLLFDLFCDGCGAARSNGGSAMQPHAKVQDPASGEVLAVTFVHESIQRFCKRCA